MATAPQRTQRHLTEGYSPDGLNPNPRPQLLLKGRWLQELGFLIGLPVTVNVEQGKLVIELEMKV